MPADTAVLLPALRTSHDRLAAIASTLDAAALTGPSYCDDWTIAQVLSHLGSGAEIGLNTLRAARGDGEAPSNEEIWARWNALPPEEMAAGFVAADEAHLAAFEGLDPATLDTLALPFFRGPTPVADVLTFRLHEHALHAWDVQVALDPAATLLPAAVPLLLEIPPMLASFAARAAEAPGPVRLAISTTDPAGDFFFTIAEDKAELRAGTGDDPTGTLTLPAEAFLRMGSGRLDPDHTPAGTATAGTPAVADLRRIFPGY